MWVSINGGSPKSSKASILGETQRDGKAPGRSQLMCEFSNGSTR